MVSLTSGIIKASPPARSLAGFGPRGGWGSACRLCRGVFAAIAPEELPVRTVDTCFIRLA